MHEDIRKWLPDPLVAERYGRDPRTIDRWSKNPALKFPPPRYINGRKHRNVEALDAWDLIQPTLEDPPPRPGLPADRRASARTAKPARGKTTASRRRGRTPRQPAKADDQPIGG